MVWVSKLRKQITDVNTSSASPYNRKEPAGSVRFLTPSCWNNNDDENTTNTKSTNSIKIMSDTNDDDNDSTNDDMRC